MSTETTFNPAQGATYGQMAAYLSAHSGLDYHVALNWLRAESSTVRGNPLGPAEQEAKLRRIVEVADKIWGTA